MGDDDSHSTDAANDLLTTFDITRAGEDKIRSLSLEKLLLLKGQLIELEQLIDGLNVPSDGLTNTTEFLIDLLGRAGITSGTKEKMLDTIEEILLACTSAENVKLRKPKGISEVSEFLKTVFDSKGVRLSSLLFPLGDSFTPDFSRCYRLYIKDEQIRSRNRTTEERIWDSRGSNKSVVDRTLSYWCLSPGRAMQDLIRERVRCVILTSGTLYPIEPIEAELRMTFDVQLKNPHVIQPDQVRVAILTRGIDGQTLNSTYAVRERMEFRMSLGLTLLDIMPIVPAGLLVFFPSYSMMNQCLETWKTNQIYDRMLRYKRIFTEPRDKLQFNKVFTDYRDAAATRNDSSTDADGAVLFAVMRGRASEGMDLADYAGRGVVILGLPYPPFMDPRVKLKMAYLDEQHTELMNQASSNTARCDIPASSHPTGRKWYNIQAWRTVNQSVGRVIRHHRDFGAVFLCDERFAAMASKSQLPNWMQSSLYVYKEVEMAIRETASFYKCAQIKYTGSNSNASIQNNLPSVNGKPKRFSLAPKPDKHRDVSTTVNQSLKHLLDDVPKANQIEVFAQSFAPKDLLSIYTPARSELKHADPNEENSASCSIFDSIVNTPVNITESAFSSQEQGDESSGDEDLADKLIRTRPAKRLRVTHTTNLCESPITRFIQAVRSYFQEGQTPTQCRTNLTRFKQALQAYQTASRLSDQVSGMECVDILFGQLNTLFSSPEARKLLSDAVCFLHEAHRTRFTELCNKPASHLSMQTVTNLSTDQTDVNRMRCSKCDAKPAQTPLISSCKHVACFSCWRTIIEEGNKRCPTCDILLRRRNLTRLVNSQKLTGKS